MSVNSNGLNKSNIETILNQSLNDVFLKSKNELDKKINNNKNQINMLEKTMKNICNIFISSCASNDLNNELENMVNKLIEEKKKLLLIIKELQSINESQHNKIKNMIRENVSNFSKISDINDSITINRSNNKRNRISSNLLVKNNMKKLKNLTNNCENKDIKSACNTLNNSINDVNTSHTILEKSNSLNDFLNDFEKGIYNDKEYSATFNTNLDLDIDNIFK